MEAYRKIVKLVYKGERDQDGLPHGEGYLEYLVDGSKPLYPQYPDLEEYYREVGRMIYKGHFEHGIRQGKGYLAELGLCGCNAHEWYSEGDYDCGRLIHPEHPEGSYRDDVCMKSWRDRFDGTWQDDMPLKHKWWSEIDPRDVEFIRHTCKDQLEQDFDFAHLPSNQ